MKLKILYLFLCLLSIVNASDYNVVVIGNKVGDEEVITIGDISINKDDIALNVFGGAGLNGTLDNGSNWDKISFNGDNIIYANNIIYTSLGENRYSISNNNSTTNSMSNNILIFNGDFSIEKIIQKGIRGNYGNEEENGNNRENNIIMINGTNMKLGDNSNINGAIIGGYGGGSVTGNIQNNKVVISGSNNKLVGDIYGAYISGSGNVQNNQIIINGTSNTFNNTNLYGGYSSKGNADGNFVVISNNNTFKANSNIYGGFTNTTGKTANNNTIILNGALTNLSNVNLWGGRIGTTTNATTGNKLIIDTNSSLSIKSAQNFDTLNFYLPTQFTNELTLASISTSFDLSKITSLALFFKGTNDENYTNNDTLIQSDLLNWNLNDSIILLSNVNDTLQESLRTKKITNGDKEYTFNINVSDGKLVATLGNIVNNGTDDTNGENSGENGSGENDGENGGTDENEDDENPGEEDGSNDGETNEGETGDNENGENSGDNDNTGGNTGDTGNTGENTGGNTDTGSNTGDEESTGDNTPTGGEEEDNNGDNNNEQPSQNVTPNNNSIQQQKEQVAKKSLAEGQIAAITTILTSNILSQNSIDIAVQTIELNKTQIADNVIPFSTISVGVTKYETGSHVNVKNFNILVGTATKNDNLTFGAFGEFGKGDYTTHNDTNGEVLRGSGNSKNIGVGIMSRYNFSKDLYGDGVIKYGKVYNSFESSNAGNTILGNVGNYDSTNTYSSGSVGVAKNFNLNILGGSELLTKLTYTFTKINGNSVKLKNGDVISFDDVVSSQISLNSKLKKDAYYGGIGIIQEFNGDVKGNYNGAGIEAPTLKGNTISIGVGYENKFNEWYINGGINAYYGMRTGIEGNLAVIYEF